jgi:adenine-specific DNA-methyltransferase
VNSLPKADVRHRRIGGGLYTWVENSDGDRVRLAGREADEHERLMRPAPLTSQTTRGGQTTGFPVDVEGVVYRPIERRLEDESCRHGSTFVGAWLLPIGKTLTYVRFLEDFPVFPYTNLSLYQPLGRHRDFRLCRSEDLRCPDEREDR